MQKDASFSTFSSVGTFTLSASVKMCNQPLFSCLALGFEGPSQPHTPPLHSSHSSSGGGKCVLPAVFCRLTLLLQEIPLLVALSKFVCFSF